MTGPTPRPRRADAGFTLIEVLVSLALFAMIAGAGVAVLDQILRAQTQTGARLDRLAQVQRALHLLARDLSEAAAGSVQGDAAGLTLSRDTGTGRIAVRYALEGGQMLRAVTGAQGEASAQALLTGVAALRWQYLPESGGWQDAVPQPPAALRAVELQASLRPGEGDLRRVIALPVAGPP